jgi:hypothetical protein
MPILTVSEAAIIRHDNMQCLNGDSPIDFNKKPA